MFSHLPYCAMVRTYPFDCKLCISSDMTFSLLLSCLIPPTYLPFGGSRLQLDLISGGGNQILVVLDRT
jgi:hypothetical protein